jgi:hypothetical protein
LTSKNNSFSSCLRKFYLLNIRESSWASINLAEDGVMIKTSLRILEPILSNPEATMRIYLQQKYSPMIIDKDFHNFITHYAFCKNARETFDNSMSSSGTSDSHL